MKFITEDGCSIGDDLPARVFVVDESSVDERLVIEVTANSEFNGCTSGRVRTRSGNNYWNHDVLIHLGAEKQDFDPIPNVYGDEVKAYEKALANLQAEHAKSLSAAITAHAAAVSRAARAKNVASA